VQAHLRREKRNKSGNENKNQGLKIDYSGMNVTFNGKSISFTKTEFEIIEFLSMNPGQVFSREKIYENVIGFNSDGDNTVITEHIRKIRNKFIAVGSESCIETVWGVGYRWIS
jgi:DNA-binding response OmpR family regulator